MSVISVIIALFENMHGKLDNAVPQLLFIIVNELQFLASCADTGAETVESALYQAFAMAFSYNSTAVFNWL